MNAWFERLTIGLKEGISGQARLEESTSLTPGEIEDLLQLAGEAARTSGARQYAPLATYIAGRLVERSGDSDEAQRRELIRAVARAVKSAGSAGD